MSRIRPYLALVALAVVAFGLLVFSDVQHDREERAAGLTLPVGLSLERRCDLARARVRVPIPWPVRCIATPWPEGWTVSVPGDEDVYRSGQILYGFDGDRWKAQRIEVYAGTDAHPQDLDFVAEMIGHEVGHGYAWAVFSGGDESDDWVPGHEPYAAHWGRCVTTRDAPC